MKQMLNLLSDILPTVVVLITNTFYSIDSYEDFILVWNSYDTMAFLLNMLPGAVMGVVIGR
jgi:hypothetical protein